jgi:hypothetical protein
MGNRESKGVSKNDGKKEKKMTKQIKIEYKNYEVIVSALRAINGKKDSHTYTYGHQIEKSANDAELRLEALSIPKKSRIGAEYVTQSGEELPSAYKYGASTTTVTMVRKSGGWYITDIKSSTLYPRSKPVRSLRITQEQDAIAIAAIRNGYKVI